MAVVLLLLLQALLHKLRPTRHVCKDMVAGWQPIDNTVLEVCRNPHFATAARHKLLLLLWLLCYVKALLGTLAFNNKTRLIRSIYVQVQSTCTSYQRIIGTLVHPQPQLSGSHNKHTHTTAAKL